jgi:hypothetical protein
MGRACRMGRYEKYMRTVGSEKLKGRDYLQDRDVGGAELIQETVSKYVTNRSKTAVMDVIGFLYVILGSSTVQLHDSRGSRCACECSEAGFGSQNGDRTWCGPQPLWFSIRHLSASIRRCVIWMLKASLNSRYTSTHKHRLLSDAFHK